MKRRLGRICGEKRHAYRLLVGKPEERNPLAGPRHRWKHNLTINPKEIVPEGEERIHLVMERRGWRVLASDHVDENSDSTKCWEHFG